VANRSSVKNILSPGDFFHAADESAALPDVKLVDLDLLALGVPIGR
jgi:hypothetical protein